MSSYANPPIQLELRGNGPFVTPIIVGCTGLAIVQASTPDQLRFVVQGPKELHIPIEVAALERLYELLKARFDASFGGDWS